MKLFVVIIYDAFNSHLVQAENRVLCERGGLGKCEAATRSAAGMKCQVYFPDPSLSDQTAPWK